MRKRTRKIRYDVKCADPGHVPVRPKAGQELRKNGGPLVGVVQYVRGDGTFKLLDEQPTRWPCTWENVQHQGYRFTDTEEVVA